MSVDLESAGGGAEGHTAVEMTYQEDGYSSVAAFVSISLRVHSGLYSAAAGNFAGATAAVI